MNSTGPTLDDVAEDLIRARLVDRPTAYQLVQSFRRDEVFADADGFVASLIASNTLTKFQAERVKQGRGKSLALGVYILRDRIPGGTMGEVFRAKGRADAKNYVVKVLPERNEWHVRTARNQAKAFECLGPVAGLLPFIDVGTAQGLHYLVWPYSPGRPLTRKVADQGILPTPEIARLGIELARILAACHACKLFHGLVKPTNVIEVAGGSYQLLDFGVGALLADNADESDGMIDTYASAATSAGMLDCASPESVLEPSMLTGAGDQYSLGCVLYYAATGRYPFPGGNAIDKVVAHQTRVAPGIDKFHPEIPPGFVGIVERLMAKSPAMRYRKLEDLIAALKPYADMPMPAESVAVDSRTPPPRRPVQLKAEAPAPPPPPAKKGWLGRVFGG